MTSNSTRCHRPNHLHGKRAGGALVLALVSVVTVAGLTAAFLQLSTAVSRRQAHMRDKMQAFYMAEAGLAEAWAAVQIKKSGNVGTEEDPALYGDGLFWVEATDMGGRLIQLESTGMVGSATAVLSLVVEEGLETVADLGVYSPTSLDLPPGTFLDGYDSRLGYKDGGALRLTSDEDLEKLLEEFLQQMEGSELGGLSGPLGASAPRGDRGGGTPSPPPPGDDPLELPPAPEPVVVEDEFAGRIASGGGITVNGTVELPTVIQGDLVPSPQDTVSMNGTVSVTGSTDPAADDVELPAIEVPVLNTLAACMHSGSAPLLMLPTEAHLPSLEVAQGSEVIVQGPATLVIDSLTLAAGARLYLDTTEGEVTIYVTTAASFAENAQVLNSTEDPANLSLNISAQPAEPIGLPAGAPIHGVIYAPDAELTVPPGFELFGSLVAQQVTFAAPPRLHFDENLAEVARERALPSLFSWRIVELENALLGPGANDPFVRLGVNRAALLPPARVHEDNPLDITYEDNGGLIQNYAGPESAFDWSQVRKPKALSRGGEKVIGEEDLKAVTAPTIDPLAKAVDDPAKNSSDVRDLLLAATPISKDALLASIHREPEMNSSHLKDVLEANAPLNDQIMLEALRNSTMSSSDLKSVLLTMSPGLSAQVLMAAAAYLAPSDLLSVQGAQ